MTHSSNARRISRKGVSGRMVWILSNRVIIVSCSRTRRRIERSCESRNQKARIADKESSSTKQHPLPTVETRQKPPAMCSLAAGAPPGDTLRRYSSVRRREGKSCQSTLFLARGGLPPSLGSPYWWYLQISAEGAFQVATTSRPA